MTFDPHAFADWCREKPVDERYSPYDPRVCALAQYGHPGVHSSRLKKQGIPLAVYQAAASEWTFGALADRLAKMGY